MNTSMKVILFVALLAILAILLVGVLGVAALLPFRTSIQETNQSESGGADPAGMGLANPASEYCLDQGYVLHIVEDQLGSQMGICNFPDGSQCEEWAYYRGECSPASGD